MSFTAGDDYCLDGQRLRPVSGGWSQQREYRTERESYAKIIAHSSAPNDGVRPQPDSFEVRSKNGLILTYGGAGHALIRSFRHLGTDPEDPALTISNAQVTGGWALRRIADRHGNAIDIHYRHTAQTDQGMRSDEMVVDQITYGPDRLVQFLYETRPDLIDHFEPGITGALRFQTRSRLKTIEMYVGQTVLRRYRLDYQSGNTTARSLLARIAECDSKDVCLNPLEFDWSPGAYTFDDVSTQIPKFTFPLSGDTYIPADIDGDGDDDLLYGNQNNDWKMRINQRPAGFGAEQDAGIPNTGDRFHRPIARPIDFNRDGRMDILTEVSAGSGRTKLALYRSTGTSFQLHAPDIDDTSIGTGTGQTNSAYFVDLDGNGLPDYISPRVQSATSQRWFYRLNQPSGFDAFRDDNITSPRVFDSAHQVRSTDFDGDGFANLLLWDDPAGRYEKISYDAGALTVATRQLNLPYERLPENEDRRSLHFADVNCDGLQDAIYPFSGLKVQLNTGNGFSQLIDGPGVNEWINPDRGTLSGNRGVRVVDFNHDGCDDVLVLHRGTPTSETQFHLGMQLYVWRSGQFVRIPLMRPAPAVGSADEIQLLDFDGDGLLDIAHFEETGTRNLRILRRQGTRPDQLIRVRVPGLGDRVEVDYTTLADANHYTPCATAYPLFCPRRGGSIVAQHRLANGLGGDAPWHSFDHSYTAARIDLLGRGWLGFEEHTVIDGESGATRDVQFNNTQKREHPTLSGTATTYPRAFSPASVTDTISSCQRSRETAEI